MIQHIVWIYSRSIFWVHVALGNGWKTPMFWLYVAPSTPISKPGRYRSSLWKLSQSPLARTCDASKLNVGWYKMEQVYTMLQWQYVEQELRKGISDSRKEFFQGGKVLQSSQACPVVRCSWSGGASKTIQWQIMIVTTMIVRFNIVLYYIRKPC